MKAWGWLVFLVTGGAIVVAQTASVKPFQARSSSTVAYSSKDGAATVAITNVAYELTGDAVPGRARGSLLLRSTTQSTQVTGDKGVEATVTMEAWPLGVDPQEKPLYSVKTEGIGAQTLDGALWVADRGIDPDVSWWSVYQLGTGEHLLDTYVELLKFSISREQWTRRYAGLDVPPDDTRDAKLKDPRVVAILTYASAEKVIREALITCDHRERATILRSYVDTSRTLSVVERPMSLRIAFSMNYPSPANSTVVTIPIVKDDLDLQRAALPAGFHAEALRR